MHMYIHIGGLTIPSYGLMIVLGVISANIVGLFVLKKAKLDLYDFIILEAYAFLGGFIGAKLLYLAVSWKYIEWSRITNLNYFNDLMRGGFVFYGGLIGGVLTILLGGKIHHIHAAQYIQNFIFGLPWIHCFGRIGCFMAGCCYGRAYNGIFAVVFPEGSIAPAGVSLFPVQIVEAIALFMIACLILLYQLRKDTRWTVEIYFITYAILRWGLEFVRDDQVRGRFLIMSTSQWISVLLVGIAFVSIYNKKRCAAS